MAVTLPLLFFALAAWRADRIHADGKGPALLRAAVTWGAVSVIIIELLSGLRALSPLWIGLAWSVASLAILVPGLWREPRVRHPLPLRSVRSRRLASAYLTPCLAGLSLLVICVGLAAVLSPPGPIDVHLYHMPRVLFWLQNRQIAHYPTTYYQQLFQPPWAEQAVLHLYALTPGDRFVNLVHFASYLGNAIAVLSAAAELGASRVGQLTAAAFALTLPQAILTASGTKNDLTVAFWLLVALYFALHYVRTKQTFDAVYLAFATDLALLTKATAYAWLVGLPVVIGVAHGRPGVQALLRIAPIVIAAGLGLSGGHYLRNQRTFGSPLGCPSATCGDLYKFAND